jgi:hypothetical protein
MPSGSSFTGVPAKSFPTDRNQHDTVASGRGGTHAGAANHQSALATAGRPPGYLLGPQQFGVKKLSDAP